MPAKKLTFHRHCSEFLRPFLEYENTFPENVASVYPRSRANVFRTVFIYQSLI